MPEPGSSVPRLTIQSACPQVQSFQPEPEAREESQALLIIVGAMEISGSSLQSSFLPLTEDKGES